MVERNFWKRLDFCMLFVIGSLMLISLFIISSATSGLNESQEDSFFTPIVKNQIKWFVLGFVVYLAFALFDYRKLRQVAFPLYCVTILLLLGLFFVPAIQNVNRWYRIPGIGFNIQPSEQAKLVVVMTLSWYLESKSYLIEKGRGIFAALAIALIPFFLILKQPDLGTALVLYPISLVMFYIGGIKKSLVKTIAFLSMIPLIVIAMMFSSAIPHDKAKPVATIFLKDYQYERLNPDTYHQKASQTSIALGSLTGSGWKKSTFMGRNWLPAPHTDSVFASYAEEFGLVGVFFLLTLFFALIYFGFRVTVLAKDLFGRLLSAGIVIYFTVHIVINVGMMCGFLPITGVPLMLLTYGGSSVISSMAALGILQSIYSRRFMF